MAGEAPYLRKRRTRPHVIADRSVNHVERRVLRCGHVVDRPSHDYGIDLTLTTFDGPGQVEPGQVFLQLKATDRPRWSADRTTVAVTVETADLAWWLVERTPVILVLYDAVADVAHWMHVQAFFAGTPGFRLAEVGATVTVRIPAVSRFDGSAVRRVRLLRDAAGRR